MLSIKEEAVKLREKGYSYSFITDKLKVPKSTLNYWSRFINYKPNKTTLKRIKNAVVKSAVSRNKLRIMSLNKIKQAAKIELGKINKRDLFLTGIGLYWGEGRKFDESVSITNSNSKIIKFYIYWITHFCNVPREDLRAEIHLYPDNNINQCLMYWKKVTTFNENQFYKTQIDNRTGKNRRKTNSLPYGTIHIFMTAKHLGIRKLHRKITAWIENLSLKIK